MLADFTNMPLLGAHRQTRPFSWSANNLARALTKWNQACGKIFGQVDFTARVVTDSIATWETQHHNAHLDCVKMLTVRVIWQIKKQRQEEFCVLSEAERLFQLGGPVRTRTAVRYSSTEAQVISLDAGLRLDGIPGL